MTDLDKLYENALAAMEKLGNNTAIARDDLIDALMELKYEIEVRVEAIKDDMEEESKDEEAS